MAKTTINFDGDCPLCRAEIARYARADSTGALDLVDVADEGAQLPAGTDRATLFGQFHVAIAADRLLSGAAAFVEVWRRLPGWRLLAGLARIPGVTPVMEGGYRLFLPLRPIIVRAFVGLAGARRAP